MSLTGDMDAAVDTAAASSTPAPADSTPVTPATPSTPAPAASPRSPNSATAPPPVASTAPARVPTGTPPPAVPPPTAATVPPDVDEADAELFTNPKGAIPVANVHRILANARTKVTASVAKHLTDNVYGLSPEVYQQLDLRSHHQALLKDPATYWRDLGRTLRSRGVTLPSLEDSPSNTRQPAAISVATPSPASRPAPDIIATLEDGSRVSTYSEAAITKLFEWQQQQLEAKFGQQLAPLQEMHKAGQEQAVVQQAWSEARAQFEDAKTWEGFADIQQDVYELMKRDGRYSLDGAYNKMFREKYLPGLKARQRQELVQEIKQAPVVGKTIAPSSAAPRGTAVNGKRGRGLDWDTAIGRALDQVTAR